MIRTVIYRTPRGSAAEKDEEKGIKQLLQDQDDMIKMLITHNSKLSHRLAAVKERRHLRLPSPS